MKRLLSLIALFYALNGMSQTTWSRTMVHLPDSGQDQDFTSIAGEDSDVVLYPLNYNVHGNGTLTDEVTGLMWQVEDGGEMTIESAIDYCDTLNLAGHSDWRLPTAHELMSIQDLHASNPSLNLQSFAVTEAEYWWSSDTQANDANKVWVTNAGGGIGNHPKSETLSAGGLHRFHVRAVRQPMPSQQIIGRFTNHGDGTITDEMTDLMWQSIVFNDTLTWENALMFADTSELSGYLDWRLPNIKELHSINQENIINPSIDPGWSGVSEARKWWSSTTLLNDPQKAWYLHSRFGITTYDIKGTSHYVRLVRGGYATSSVIEMKRNEAFVYPNPVHEWLSVRSGNFSPFEILDDQGNSIFQLSGKGPWYVGSLKPGVYFLRALNSEFKSRIIKD